MGIHDHHRQRMKEKFKLLGGESLHKHELLEMLLFFSKPQGDTNPCAHELLEHFGSVKGIFSASFDDLKQVNGVGDHTATLIKLIPELYRVYEQELSQDVRYFRTLSSVVRFLHPYFAFCQEERVFMLMLNNRMEMIDCILISKGTVNSCEILLRLISEKVHAKKAVYVVLAHNHPNGLALPSENDINITNTVVHHLSQINVVVLEHLVFSDNGFYPIIKKDIVPYYSFMNSNRSQSRALDMFYDIDSDLFQFEHLFDKKEEQNESKSVMQ